MKVTNEKELGEELKKEANSIEIEGKLAENIIKIKAVGPVAWGVIVVLLAAIVASALSTPGTGPAGAAAAVGSSTPVVAVLGIPAAVAAVKIAMASGGTKSLETLREYEMEKINEEHIILRRK